MSDCDAESMDAAFGSGDESVGCVTLDCVFGFAGTGFEICVSRDASVGQLVNHTKNGVGLYFDSQTLKPLKCL